MPTLPDDFFIQKVILLGTGAPGTVALRDELTQLYVQNEDLTQFEARVDELITRQFSDYGNNDSGAKHTLFLQGFDENLTAQKIDQLTADSLRQGIDSWHEYFSYLINELDLNTDKVLDNRAIAATAFTNLVDDRNIEVDVNVNDQRVQVWLDRVDATDDSLTDALNTLEDLINQLIRPVLVGSDPVDNAIEVPVNKDIVLTFSEAVKAGSGEIVITADDGHRIPLNVTDTTQVTFDGSSIVRLNPSEDLHFNMNYNVQANSGVITGLGGREFAGTSDPTALNFNTEVDDSPPTLDSSNPADNAVEVPVDTDIVLTFSEAVKAGTGEIVITGDDGHRVSLNVADTTQVTFDGSNIVTLNPSEDLHFNMNYNVQANSGVITDLGGIPFAGTSDPTALNFNTVVDSPPTLDSSVPVDNELRVPVNKDIVLTFSEAVKAGTGEIIITGSDDHRISLNVADITQVTFDGSIVRINPVGVLHANVNYDVQMASGVITDLAEPEKAFAGIDDSTTLNFQTEPEPEPEPPDIPLALSSTTPANNATEVVVGDDIVLTFNKTVRAGSGNIVISDDNGDTRIIPVTDTSQVTFEGRTVTINPTDNLNPITNYQVVIESNAIEDLTGIPFGGPIDLNFETVDTIAPTRIGTNPADGATEIAINNDIVLTFDETVQAGSGDIVISDNNGDTRTIPVTDTSQVTFSDNTVTINPAADLNPSTTYQVSIDNSVITDLADNAYEGDSDLDFVTIDTIVPTLSSTNPADNATEVPLDSDIVLTFDETVQAGSGNIIINSSLINDTRTIAVTDTSQITFSGNSVAIDPASDFVFGFTNYNVQIDSSVIVDLVGNAYGGTSFNFQTDGIILN